MSKSSSKAPADALKVLSISSLENSAFYVPAALAIMMLATVLLFSGFLFSGKMLYGTDTITAGYFHRSFMIDHFKDSGQIPGWNPLAYGGMPYIDAIHGDIFYPFSVLKFFLPLYFYLGFNLMLHIMMAGVFMYLAARQLKLGKTAALVSAACYMSAPYLVSMVAPGHDAKIYTTALFPLVMLFLDRGFERNPFLNFTILGFVLGAIILTPQPETAYFTFWAVGLYSLFKLVKIWRESHSIRNTFRPASLVFYALILSLLFSAIQFYPSYVYATKYSARVGQEGSWEWATSWATHEEEAFSQLIPEFCGTTFPNLPPFETELFQSSYWGGNTFKDNSDSVGVVAIFLAFFGLFYVRRAEAIFFAVLALLTFAYALGAITPIYEFFYFFVPKVALIRSPAKILFIFSFAISLLAGMGTQTISDQSRSNETLNNKLLNIWLVAFPALLFLLAVAFTVKGEAMLSFWTSIFPNRGNNMEIKGEVTKYICALKNLPDIQRGAWFSSIFTMLSAALIWEYRNGKMRFAIIAFLIFMPFFDGARFNGRFINVIDPSAYFEPNQLVSFLKSNKSDGRVLSLSRQISKSYLPQNGIEVVQGYHGNQLLWYDYLIGGLNYKNRLNPRFLNLVGAHFAVIPNDAQLREDYFGPIPSRTVAVIGKDQIVQNDNAFPRAFLVNKYRVFHQLPQISYAIINGDENLRNIVYLEKIPPVQILPDSMRNDSAWIISKALDTVVVEVRSSSERILVLMDNYYDAWHAEVDGHPTEILRTYGSFRGVCVPAGAKEVVFTYHPDRYELGKLLTSATSIYLLFVFGFHFYQTRRKNHLS